MRIAFSKLTRTHLGFPSEWKGLDEEGNNVYIHYRQGKITIKINEVVKLETCKDEFDVGGYLEDEELQMVLARHEILVDEE